MEDVTLMVCDSGLKAMRVAEDALLPGVAIVGLPTFLESSAEARLAVF
jgi:predicted peroxiredoxin